MEENLTTYCIYKKNHTVTPNEVINVVDLGYLGVETDFPGQLSTLPYKKRYQEDLSQEEKEYNRIHSKKRIVIEHTICRLKKYRILADIFRNKLRKYNRISDIVSGLVNYRIINLYRWKKISNRTRKSRLFLIMQEIYS
jgi:hypothetical protein